jgi:hypothetical protein
MNLRDPLVAYWRFRSAEMSETQSLLLAEMFSDLESFLEDCKSSLVLFRKLHEVGFLEEASLVLAEIYWSEIATRYLTASEPRSQSFLRTQIHSS